MIHHRDADLIRGGKSTLGCSEAVKQFQFTPRYASSQMVGFASEVVPRKDNPIPERFAVARAELGKMGLIQYVSPI